MCGRQRMVCRSRLSRRLHKPAMGICGSAQLEVCCALTARTSRYSIGKTLHLFTKTASSRLWFRAMGPCGSARTEEELRVTPAADSGPGQRKMGQTLILFERWSRTLMAPYGPERTMAFGGSTETDLHASTARLRSPTSLSTRSIEIARADFG